LARILYFAQLRERAGTGEEDVALPAEVKTGRDLIRWLGEERPELAEALASARVRMALDQELAPLTASVTGAKEIALFPPMTGG
jgi:molybdopterin synthase sulfur carrier subunit